MNLSGKKLLLFGFLFVLLVAIPLTIFMLQQQQQTQSQAAPATTLSMDPKTTTITQGSSTKVTITLDPKTNFVAYTKLVITYDATKLATSAANSSCGASFCLLKPDSPDKQGFTQILAGPEYTIDRGVGRISLTASPGISATNIIQGSIVQIAEVTFQGIAPGTANVGFETGPNNTYVYSSKGDEIDPNNPDPKNENVLASTEPATITVTAITPTATATPTVPVATISATVNQVPVCTNLLVDRTTSGTAPFTLTFTTTGNDPDGTINKATFSFGDGTVEDVGTSGGIGTATINVQKAHTYQNPGVFTALAVLTDNANGTSLQSACKQTITVIAPVSSGGSSSSSGSASSGSGDTASAGSAEATPTTDQPKPTIAATGPGNALVGVGIVGAVLSVLGAVVFFIL
jgi:hypothetical protein